MNQSMNQNQTLPVDYSPPGLPQKKSKSLNGGNLYQSISQSGTKLIPAAMLSALYYSMRPTTKNKKVRFHTKNKKRIRNKK